MSLCVCVQGVCFTVCVHNVCSLCLFTVCVCVHSVCVDGVVGATVVLYVVYNKTTAALITPSENDIMFSKNTLRFPKATVKPLRATESHCRATSWKKVRHYCLSGLFRKMHSEPLRVTEKAWESHKKPRPTTPSRQGPALPSSRVTGVWDFQVRGFCSRIVFGRAGALVKCSTCARVHRTKTSNTPITAHKHFLHTHCGAQKSRDTSRHSHCPVDTAPPMWCSLVGGVVAVLRTLSSTGAIITDLKGVTER